MKIFISLTLFLFICNYSVRGNEGIYNQIKNKINDSLSESYINKTNEVINKNSSGKSQARSDAINVTAQVGQSVDLYCIGEAISNEMVTWIRLRDLHLLAVGHLTYTMDERFATRHGIVESNDWALQIKHVQPMDEGLYECQLNSDPPRSQYFNLHVVENEETVSQMVNKTNDSLIDDNLVKAVEFNSNYKYADKEDIEIKLNKMEANLNITMELLFNTIKELEGTKKQSDRNSVQLKDITFKLNSYLKSFGNRFYPFTDSDGKQRAFIFPLNEYQENFEISWDEANNTCNKYNASLVEINSQEKEKNLESFVTHIRSKSENFWLNARKDSSGKWKWLRSGNNFTYNKWEKSYPNSTFGDYIYIASFKYDRFHYFSWKNCKLTCPAISIICEMEVI